ncbi:putative two-component histidine kinase [Flavihumibacter petaseus NBRC 106054]|uniref:Putative two-component histidine kinase n=2 Tax=Flavihumibacter TaxID=1004301 RepID=A0A0E9MZK0_9BACT|nr:putative two-component histidine kinase [Flavihumibacter petaseus NBRC 106054]
MFALACICQARNLDSLYSVSRTLRDSARVDYLFGINICYEFSDNTDSARHYIRQMQEISEQCGYTRGIALTWLCWASLYNFTERPVEESEASTWKALYWFGKVTNKKGIEVAFFQLGIAKARRNQWKEALQYYDKAFGWARLYKDTAWMENALGARYEPLRDAGEYARCFEWLRSFKYFQKQNNREFSPWLENYLLAELNRCLGNYEKALQYYRKVVNPATLSHENIWFRVCFPELFFLNGQSDSARHYYNLIDSSALTTHDRRFYLTSMGEFLLSRHEDHKALDYLLPALPLAKQAHDITVELRLLTDIANAYLNTDSLPEALFITRKALSLAGNTHARQRIRDAYQLLYSIYDRKKQPDSAYHYYRQYVVQKESVADDVLKGKLAAYDYERQIEMLRQTNTIQQSALDRASLMRNALLGGLALVLMLGMISVRIAELKRRNEKMRLSHELEIQSIEAKKSQAELQQQATELKMQALRSQMNPHFIFNCLNSINRFILKNESDDASGYLTKFSRLIRMVLNHSQRSAILLEDELETLKLYLDLEKLRFRNAFDYSICFHNRFNTAAIYLPPLLIQPFAENAIWHGLMHKEEKGHLEIAIRLVGHILTCTITDDGIGRAMARKLNSKSTEKQKSMGMHITTGRIELLNRNMQQASVDVDDLYDMHGNPSGTKVTLTVAYAENDFHPVNRMS